jgi:hypothetical protein
MSFTTFIHAKPVLAMRSAAPSYAAQPSGPAASRAIALAATSILLCCAEGYAAPKLSNAQPEIAASVKLSGRPGQGLRLEARHARWEQIFLTMRTQIGLDVHYPAVPQCSVSTTCSVPGAKQLVECLFGTNASVIYRYPKGKHDRDPAEAWVMSDSSEKDKPTKGGELPALCKPGQTPIANAEAKSTVLPEPASTAAPPNPDSVDGLLILVHSDNLEQRMQALSQLAGNKEANDAEVHAELESALTDKNAAVRAQAVFGYARRDGMTPDRVLHSAMRDPNVSVRLMAIDVASTSDANGSALLRRALNDGSETVRTLARMKLDEGAKQRP